MSCIRGCHVFECGYERLWLILTKEELRPFFAVIRATGMCCRVKRDLGAIFLRPRTLVSNNALIPLKEDGLTTRKFGCQNRICRRFTAGGADRKKGADRSRRL
jgi:hypothetical protein